MNKKSYILYTGFCKNRLICGTTLKGKNYALHTAQDTKEMGQAAGDRALLTEELGFSSLITLNQIHSNIIHFVNPASADQYKKNQFIDGDGLLSVLDDVLIGVLTADCLPVFYTDKKGSFAGIIHAGWKGIEKKIHLKMAAMIRNKIGVEKEDLIIMIGPHINKCCYEVGKELIEALGTTDYIYRDKKYFLDMKEMVKNGLITEGIKESNILSYSGCTKCGTEKSFYSFRNGNKTERMLSFIGFCK